MVAHTESDQQMRFGVYYELIHTVMSITVILGLCLGWKGQFICCVTRGREGGRGWEGRGGDGRVG